MDKSRWERLSKPPREALKQIKGGRLSGMTDINPQWRLKAMNDEFGPCGEGWKYEIVRLWTEPATDEQVFAFAHVHVYVESGEVSRWSDPIPGIGGSMLISKEKGGLHSNDEAFKMAVTDALSVALKALGVGSAIYEGRWDGSKYRDTPSAPITPTTGAQDVIAPARLEALQRIASSIVEYCDSGDIQTAHDAFYEIESQEEKIAVWDMLKEFSGHRAAIKKHHDKLKGE